MNLKQIEDELRRKSQGIPPLNKTLKIDFGGEYIFIDGLNNNAINTKNSPAHCTVRISKANFIKLKTGRLTPTWGYLSGKIKIQGDKSVLGKLKSLLN